MISVDLAEALLHLFLPHAEEDSYKMLMLMPLLMLMPMLLLTPMLMPPLMLMPTLMLMLMPMLMSLQHQLPLL
jgi:hypothetical protein